MKIKCNCPCHKDPNFKHIKSCCVGGYVEIPDTEAGLYPSESPSPSLPVEPEKVLRWVKFSKELPPSSMRVFAKNLNGDLCIFRRNNNLEECLLDVWLKETQQPQPIHVEPEPILRWVKAGERTPENNEDKEICIRIRGMEYYGSKFYRGEFHILVHQLWKPTISNKNEICWLEEKPQALPVEETENYKIGYEDASIDAYKKFESKIGHLTSENITIRQAFDEQAEELKKAREEVKRLESGLALDKTKREGKA